MKTAVAAAAWRFAIFGLVCALGAFGLFMVFAELRFGKENTFNAEFSNVSGLEGGNFVRIAGVEVGKVKTIRITPQKTALVQFSADPSVVLTEGTRAMVRYENLIGGRYLALEEGASATQTIKPGDTIPLQQTAPALDLDALIGGFRPLFRALDPEQVNALSSQLIAAFQGQGATIASFLTQTATVTSALADRDELIGQVIDNLGAVLKSLGDESRQFDKSVDSLSRLVSGLYASRTEVSESVANVDRAAVTVADLLDQARVPLKETVAQTDRVSSLILTDHEYVENLLDGLPGIYKILNRQGMHGDYFSFYLCEAVLKLNGKGGNPVFVSVANQTTGRCAPK